MSDNQQGVIWACNQSHLPPSKQAKPASTSQSHDQEKYEAGRKTNHDIQRESFAILPYVYFNLAFVILWSLWILI